MTWAVYNTRKEGQPKRGDDIVWVNTNGSPTPTEPKIVGADDTSIPQGTDFDLSVGVKAYDAQGNEIPFTVTPDSIDECAVGEQTFTYSADGVTKTRKITITQILNPTISGLTELTVEVGEEFDPLDGVTAEDGNGNPVEVTVEQPEQYITLLEVSNYTAPNDVPIAKPNTWDTSKGTELVIEATGVVVNGTTETGAEYAYFDGMTTNPSIAVSLDVMPEVYEAGAGVWFYTDPSDNTKFISSIGTEGMGELLPTTVSFESLIVKQKVVE